MELCGGDKSCDGVKPLGRKFDGGDIFSEQRPAATIRLRFHPWAAVGQLEMVSSRGVEPRHLLFPRVGPATDAER